jgi:hypothetical protein
VQVIWILYNPYGAHYDALVPATEVDKLAMLDLQKSILKGVKQEAKDSKVRARQVRYVHPPRHAQTPADDAAFTEAEEEGNMDSPAQLHQGLDADGIVRDLAAYLEGAPSVVRRRLPLVFPNDASQTTSNVRSCTYLLTYHAIICTTYLHVSLVIVLLVIAYARCTCLYTDLSMHVLFGELEYHIALKLHEPTARTCVMCTTLLLVLTCVFI